MEIETDNTIPFLDGLVFKKETALATRVYTPPTPADISTSMLAITHV
jgi:hypothetical protein